MNTIRAGNICLNEYEGNGDVNIKYTNFKNKREAVLMVRVLHR